MGTKFLGFSIKCANLVTHTSFLAVLPDGSGFLLRSAFGVDGLAEMHKGKASNFVL